MNLNFVTFIPKMADSIRVSNFRPIVMGNFSYKIFTKIVATRLGSFIGNILSPSQYGFIPGRSIHTCIALSLETTNSMQMGTYGNMAFKMDITKAFDTISWEFLEFVLHCMHFSQRFILMVRNILHSARLSILINGTPYGFFPCSRGVRQGYSLSPLLFFLAEEALIRWLDFAANIGDITMNERLPRHLFYADDVLIFVEATRANGRNITRLLDNYGNLSGQKFSAPKSSIFFGPSATTGFKPFITRCTSISAGSLPFTYLGVPIFKGAPRAAYLAPIADSIIHKFDKWRGNTLSLAGRRCLINSIIASSLVHTMMIYRWPRNLLHKLEVAIQCYLWTGNVTKKVSLMLAGRDVAPPWLKGVLEFGQFV